MDMSQVVDYQLYPTAGESEVNVYCDDAQQSSPPCGNNVKYVFHSTDHGTGGDNPNTRDTLDELQKKRSVTFSFKDTECFNIEYQHYCKYEEDNLGNCNWYGGGNFLFSGSAQALIETGDCIDSPSPPVPLL